MLQHGFTEMHAHDVSGHMGTTNSTGWYRITQASAGLLELGELRHRCT